MPASGWLAIGAAALVLRLAVAPAPAPVAAAIPEGRGPWEKSRFLGQYACGQGIARYVQDVNGLGYG